jgi:hypothetical protein
MISIQQYILESLSKLPGANDIKKMKGYYNGSSKPDRLIATIKDDDKLIRRYGAAVMIGWDEAVQAFANAIKDRGLMTDDELGEYRSKCAGQEVDTSDMKSFSKNDKRLADSWISRSVFKYLTSLKNIEVTWKEIFKNAKTDAGRRAMSRSGSAWTEGFVVNLKGPKGDFDLTFDIVTNEGGGLYGYCTLNSDVISFKEFKDYVDYQTVKIL